jgi:phosphotransferase system HPr (HPr) family protein
MQNVRLKVINEVGLHARPAALFVSGAQKCKSQIRVRNLTAETDWVDAKSILSILTLGVEKDHEIEIAAEGEDEAAAVASLESLVRSDFSVKA